MSPRPYRGIFVAEGSSDEPLADIVESLFFDQGISVHLSKPDFGRLDRVPKDVKSRLRAGNLLTDEVLDFVVVHRDADNAGAPARRKEIIDAITQLGMAVVPIPVIPIRMTEAWLLLDEASIRLVAGNPKGKTPLNLPKVHEVESAADPKSLLSECLLKAADATGRRHERAAKRFFQHRRQLLERLDRHGPVSRLSSWQQLQTDIDMAIKTWDGEHRGR